METLELKQLLSFAPYRVKGMYLDSGMLWECDPLADEVDYDNHKLPLFHFLGREKPCKLVLYPLDWLTKEIEHNGERFHAIDFLGDISIKYLGQKSFRDYSELNECKRVQDFPYYDIQKLLKWHFNVFDLPKHLYIDKSTLKDNEKT